MRNLIFISLLLLVNQTFAVTADSLTREFYNILKICKKESFYKCQDHYFEGDNRGIFHLPIEKQKLKITEEEYKEFINNQKKDGAKLSLFKKSVNINFNLGDEFDYSQFHPKNVAGPIQPLNRDNTIFKFSFKNTPPIILLYNDGRYKFGILPEQEKEYRKSQEFKSVYLYRLKNNILRYHMKEAEMLKYDVYELEKRVSEAQAPIFFMLEKGNVPDFVKEYMSNKSMKDIQRFYINLDTEEKIVKKIKEVHKL